MRPIPLPGSDCWEVLATSNFLRTLLSADAGPCNSAAVMKERNIKNSLVALMLISTLGKYVIPNRQRIEKQSLIGMDANMSSCDRSYERFKTKVPYNQW